MQKRLPIARLLGLLTLPTVLLVAGCKKDDKDTPADKETFTMAVAGADADAEAIFEDVFDNAIGVNAEVGLGGTGIFGRVANPAAVTDQDLQNRLTGADSTTCYTVTVTQVNAGTRFPLQATIDFGTGCTGRDGRTRKGKIIFTYTGRLIVAGNSVTTAFDGYTVNNVTVAGSVSITNTSQTGQRSFTTKVTGAKLTRADGNIIEWNSEKTIMQTEGLATPFIAIDDVFAVTGQANGAVQTDNKYMQWNTAITTQLVKRFSCRWIVSGGVTISKGTAGVAVIDYGSGNCDNKAEITVNGVLHEITLH